MALIPNSTYPSQTLSPTDGSYPLGKARDVTVTGDGTGTPLKQEWVNDLWGFEQALLAAADITASGSPDAANSSQYLQAIQAICAPKHNYIVQMGSKSGTMLTSTTSTSYVAIAGGGGNNSIVSLDNTQAGDILEGDYFWGIQMNSGTAYLNLSINDGSSSAIASFEYQFTAPSPIKIIFPFRYTVVNGGTVSVNPQLKIDAGGTSANIVAFYGSSNSLFCRYKLIRP